MLIRCRILPSLLIGALLAVAVLFPAYAGEECPSTGKQHALTLFGEPKYPPGFSHFNYVNPSAPKGGRINLGYFLPFDTVHAFAMKGSKAPGTSATDHDFRDVLRDMVYDPLMVPSLDEPQAVYSLIAETAEVGCNNAWVEFTLRPEARWHDGTPITVDDVLFTFRILPEKGDPAYKVAFAPIKEVVRTGEHSIRFLFKEPYLREMPMMVASIPILPKAYWEVEKRDFSKSTLIPPLASGAYRISNVDIGRTVTYERVKDYWAQDLPVNKGQNNFDIVHFQSFRDPTAALEGIKSGHYDVREENISRSWATAYEIDALKQGKLVKTLIPHENPTGNQAFIFNTERYPDRRVREAIALAFDFEWTNRVIFYNTYTRNYSFFGNTPFAATELPSEAELALLEPYRAQLPEEVFTKVYHPPTTEGNGTTLRNNLIHAQKLLNEAGYIIKNGQRVHKDTGQVLSISFLYTQAGSGRVIAPFIHNLQRLGIQAQMQYVEIAQYGILTDNKDYDAIIWWYNPGVAFPGNEQRQYWGCSTVNEPGSANFAKVCTPLIDMLIEKIEQANTLEELKTAARALDRVLLWEHYSIPQYHLSAFRLIYWDKFGRPAVAPTYDKGVSTWWAKNAKGGK